MMNVLNAALSVLPKQAITYKKFKGRLPNAIGIMVNTYETPVTVTGSIQPADAQTLYQMGIANTGDIWFLWVKGNVLSTSELDSNDIIVDSSGNIYNIFRSDKWSSYPDQDWNRIFVRRAKEYGK